MEFIEPISQEMLRRYLEKENLSFLTDEDGDFVVPFVSRPELPYGFMVGLILSERVFAFRATLLSSAEADAAAEFCRFWNRRRRWPKATLPAGEDDGPLVLEADLPVEPGVHQDFLDRYLGLQIGGAIQFCKELDLASRLGDVGGQVA